MRSRVVMVLSAAVLATSGLSGCGSSGDTAGKTGVAASPYAKGNYPGILKIGNPYDIAGRTYFPAHEPDYIEEGVASWYGPGFHGRATANGERFDQNALTAAHRTLPMPSVVRVTNLENGRAAVLKVNDRGPFAKDRIIDLSKRAATDLGVIANGTARVRVEYLEDETRQMVASLLRNNAIKADDKTLSLLAMNDLPAGVVSDAPSGPGLVAGAHAAEPTAQPVYAAARRGVVERAPLAPVSSRHLDMPQGRAMTGEDTAGTQMARIERSAPAASAAIPYSEGGVVPRTMPLEVPPVNVMPDIAPLPTPSMAPRSTPQGPDGAKPSPSPRRAPLRNAPPPDDATPPPPRRPNDLQELPQGVQRQQAPAAPGAYIQAGAFGQEHNAHDLSRRLASLGRSFVKPVDVNGRTWYRVRLGPLNSAAEVQTALRQVKGMGLPDAHIVHD